MKSLVTAPRIYLIAQTRVNFDEIHRYLVDQYGDSAVDLPDAMDWLTCAGSASNASDSGVLCETAGRLCYLSFVKRRPGGTPEYIQHILESGHGSVLEHTAFSVLIAGVPRSFTHELVRHRAGAAYSQQSQRYVNEADAQFVMPADVMKHPDAANLWQEAVQQAKDTYKKLADVMAACMDTGDASQTVEQRRELRKIVRQSARAVLPESTASQIVCTLNARAWRHFFELRTSRYADTLMRKVAFMVWCILRTKSPEIFSDYAEVPLPDGTVELQTKYRKV